MRQIPGQARLVVMAVLVILFAYLYLTSKLVLAAYGWGAVALLGFWVVIWLFTGRLNPFGLVVGEDGRPSTSKLKPFLWTVVVIFAYAVLYAARVKKGYIEAISDIPPNLLIAMGFDVATLVAAKGITESQISSGQIEKPAPVDSTAKTASTPNTSANNGPGAVFQDDKGFPDLTKIQTVTWTVFAIVIYLVAVNTALEATNALKSVSPGTEPFPSHLNFPDIDPALMVLVGLGNAAYLGKKLVTTDTPVLTGISVQRKPSGTEIIVTGVGLGVTQNGSKIIVNNKEIDETPLAWANDQVKFKLPDKNPEGVDWVSGQQIRIGLFVKGQTTNQLTFTVEPALTQVSPATGAAETAVSLSGTALGATRDKLTIDNSAVGESFISSWSNNEIKFIIPPKHPDGKAWVAGQKISLGVVVQNKQSNNLEFILA